MLSYLGETDNCTLLDDDDIFDYTDENDTMEENDFHIVGSKNKKLVGSVAFEGKLGTEDFNKLYWITENRIDSPINNLKYSNNIPVAINDSYMLLYSKKTSIIYIKNGNDSITLHPKTTEALLKGLNSSRFAARGHQLVYPDKSAIYLVHLNNNAPTLGKLNCESGKHEVVEPLSVSPRKLGGYLYYIKMSSGRSEKSMSNSGLVRMNVQTGEKSLLVSTKTMKNIGLSSFNYVPLPDDEIIFLEESRRWGSTLIKINLTELNQFAGQLEKLSEELVNNDIELKSNRDEIINEAESNDDTSTKRYKELKANIKELMDKESTLRENIKKLKKDFRTEQYYLPENYIMTQSTIDQQPIFFHANPQWPLLTMNDVLKMK